MILFSFSFPLVYQNHSQFHLRDGKKAFLPCRLGFLLFRSVLQSTRLSFARSEAVPRSNSGRQPGQWSTAVLCLVRIGVWIRWIGQKMTTDQLNLLANSDRYKGMESLTLNKNCLVHYRDFVRWKSDPCFGNLMNEHYLNRGRICINRENQSESANLVNWKFPPKNQQITMKRLRERRNQAFFHELA